MTLSLLRFGLLVAAVSRFGIRSGRWKFICLGNNAFTQATGAELANGQCLICHSVEYVTSQPPMPRAFWKASVTKMQQKYAAPITDAQIDPLVDYLTKNYGVVTPGATNAAPAVAVPSSANPSGKSLNGQAVELAAKFGCLACHNTQSKIIGPAYREIAAKYKSDPDAMAKINQQIHKGGSGKWGPVIMPPFPQVTAEESKTLAKWILGLNTGK